MIDTRLQGKVVLVTGANHGIGAATARAFGAQGAAVFVHYFRIPAESGTHSPDPGALAPGDEGYAASRALTADDVVRSIHDAGGRAASWEADLSDPAAVPALFDQAERALGPVDVLINNAAYWAIDTFIPSGQDLRNRLPELWTSRATAPISPETHDGHFAVNSRAVALMMTEYLRRHIARGANWGRIVNVSTDGASCFPGEVSYGASKAALEAYSRSAAAEMGAFGITVNIVSPGPIQTGWITPELEQHLVPSIPLGRVGVPEDIADAIVFLASEQARWLTGQLLHVGGGHKM